MKHSNQQSKPTEDELRQHYEQMEQYPIERGGEDEYFVEEVKDGSNASD